MPRHITIIFPGQGSQHIGMLDKHSKNFIDTFNVNNLLGFDLIDLINNGPVEKLNATSVTQPAVLLASYIEYVNLCAKLDINPNILCGHSLGEYTALVASKSISLHEGLSLVYKRGLLMEKCQKGSMCAVLNVDLKVISKACLDVENNFNTIVSPANLNSPNQTVISGSNEGIDEVIKILKDKGHSKCIKLKVSAAPHSKVMNDIIKEFNDELNKFNFSLPEQKVLHNVDNEISSNINDLRNKLINQLVMPVQWVNTMKYISKYDGIVIECGPNKVLI